MTVSLSGGGEYLDLYRHAADLVESAIERGLFALAGRDGKEAFHRQKVASA